jgi:hypothetical protein
VYLIPSCADHAADVDHRLHLQAAVAQEIGGGIDEGQEAERSARDETEQDRLRIAADQVEGGERRSNGDKKIGKRNRRFRACCHWPCVGRRPD